jgi:hypothetical protein
MTKQFTRKHLLVSITLLLLIPTAIFSQEPAPKERPKTHLHVKVTAGEDAEPVKGADVFVKSQNADAKFERTLRTDKDGSVSFNKVPTVTILIQVTVAGFKTFGKVYDLAPDNDQTIAVRLEKDKDGGE